MNRMAAIEEQLIRQGLRLPGAGPQRRTDRARAMAAPVAYRVPGVVPPLAQQKPNGCWATVYAMLRSWKEEQSLSVEDALEHLGPEWVALYEGDQGLFPQDKPRFLAAAGLVGEPPMSCGIPGWEDLLRRFGPLWVTTDEAPGAAFSIHARVLVAIEGDGTPQGTRMELVDPAGGRGRVVREPFASFAPKYEEEAATTPRMRLQVIHWPEGARYAASQARSGLAAARGVPAVPLAGLGYKIFTDIANNKGDISWKLPRMEGALHPWDQKDRYDRGPWHEETFRVKAGGSTGPFGVDELSATFEVTFKHNGHSVGYVDVQNVGTNDAPFWGISVEGTLMPDPQAYRVDGKEPVARLDLRFTYHFQHSIRDDRIWTGRYFLYGTGNVDTATRWVQ